MTKKITIAQILPTMESGGVERGVFDLSKFILPLKDLEVIIISAGGSMVKQLEYQKIRHIKLPVNSKNPITIFINIFRLVNIIKKYNIDICHVRSRAPAWSVYFACKKVKCKFLTTFHGVYSSKGLLSNKSCFKKKYNSIMVKSKPIIAVSNFIKQHIIKEYSISENQINIIHRGADIEYFNQNNVYQERIIRISKYLKLRNEQNIVLLPGRFTSWKGHDLLLDALEQIRFEQFTCFMVGKSDKNYIANLEKKIKSKNLEHKIRIIDHISDMPALYMVSTVILSTSTRSEAFGRIAIEAGAMEKIIIATNLGGSKETVINNETGFLFDHNKSSELADKIRYVLSLDIKKREEMGQKARKRIEKYFSSKDMINDTLKIYRDFVV